MQNYTPKYPPVTPKLPPFKHQITGAEHWDSEYYALLMEQGTGKSKILIDSAAGLFTVGKINGLLILAPKGVYLNWVKNEIPIHMPESVDYFVGVWRSVMNKEQESQIMNVLSPIGGHLDILVMNIEALNSDRALMFAIKFLENHECLTVIDESSKIKNPQAQRTKKSFTIGKLSKYRRIMTGTPITKSPLDLFSQFQFLKFGCLGFTSWTAFRAYYAVIEMMHAGNRMYPKITGYKNLDHLQKDLSKMSFRILKSECLTLPPKVYTTRYSEMSDEQRKLYNKLRDEALLQFEQNLVTTTSALTLIMRLQQIACGHITLDTGEVIDLPNSRMDILEEILEETDGKVIIWCRFQRDVEQIVERLGSAAVHYYGKTTDSERAEALERFKNDPTCLYFVGTPGTGGMGLTLVESSTTIYYSNGYDLEHRLQSEDRNHRIGQTRSVTVIDIVCQDTVDERIVEIVKNKKDLASTVLDSWRGLLGLT